MIERALSIGEEAAIVGVLTQPENQTLSKPMVLLSNAGLIHRVGPHRQWVNLSRRLCEDGFPVFRFDLSGLGDSEASRDSGEEVSRFVKDLVGVINYFEKHLGTKEFVLIGLCSGAIYGHATTIIEKRIVGTIFVDGIAYRTKGWYLHYLLQNYLLPSKWISGSKRVVRKILRTCKIIKTTPNVQANLNHYRLFYPPQKEAQSDMAQLIKRNVDMLLIYTSGVSIYYNHAKQIKAMYPNVDLKKNVEIAMYPESDHTVSLLSHRKQMEDLIRQWMQRFSAQEQLK